MPSLKGVCRAAVLALLGVLLVSGVAWAQPPGAVVAEGTQDGRARLVVNGDGPITVSVGGQPQPTTTTPLVSERTAMALVVDASADGGPGLQPGLGGLVDFALGVPPTTRTTLVADTTPPAVVTQTQADPAGVLTGLSGITAGGDRQTVAALELAVAQLPREPDNPRLVVLYTGGARTEDAPEALAAALRADGVVLAVVTTADDGYWRAVADGTGGVAVGAAPSGVVDAFGRVASTLRTRSLVTLPAPERSPTPAVVRVGAQSAETVLPPVVRPVEPVIVAAGVVLGVVVLALAGVGLARLVRHLRHPVRNAHEWAAPTDEPERAAPVERGRRRRRLRPVWHVPEPAEVPTVVRRRLRRAIEDAVTSGGQAVVRPANGRSGVGVTTAMVEFAHHFREDYDVTWWIAAQDPQLIGDQMARLAEALGVAAPTDTADAATAAALAALRQRGRWLLVFDDAGPRHDLARFLPDGSGHVLVGSTDPEWEGRTVAVPPFARAESVELLRARRDGLTTADADRVATALADIPLDVAAAGATLAATGMSADDFLAALAGPATPDAASAPAATAPSAPAPPDLTAPHPPAEPDPTAPAAPAQPGTAGTDTAPAASARNIASPAGPAQSGTAGAGGPAQPDSPGSGVPTDAATGAGTTARPDTADPAAPAAPRPTEPDASGAGRAQPGSAGTGAPAEPHTTDASAPAPPRPTEPDASGAGRAQPGSTGAGAPAEAATGSGSTADLGAPAARSRAEPGAAGADGAVPTKPDAAAAAWRVAFDRLAADEPQALALLTLVAWLGSEPVPMALLSEHPDHLPAPLTTADRARLARTLADRGLALVDGESVQLHRVPAAHLVRRSADDRPDGAGWPVWAVRLLRAAVPPDPDDPASWPGWRRLMPHVLAATDPRRALDDVAVEVGWLLHHAARFLQARGEQESARALLEDAHDLYRRRLGPDDPQTAAAARALADNLRALGRHEQARRLLDDTPRST
jgi:hypothetical protein